MANNAQITRVVIENRDTANENRVYFAKCENNVTFKRTQATKEATSR